MPPLSRYLYHPTFKTSHLGHGMLVPASGLCTCSSSACNTITFLYWLVPSHPSKCKSHLFRGACPDHPVSEDMPSFSTSPPSYRLYSYQCYRRGEGSSPPHAVGVVKVLSIYLFVQNPCPEPGSLHPEGKGLAFSLLHLQYSFGALYTGGLPNLLMSE